MGDKEADSSTMRQMEVEAYSALVSALFSQGELTWRKEQMLQEVRWALNISDDLHRRELQRVHTDPMLIHLRNSTTKDQYFPGVNSHGDNQDASALLSCKLLRAYPVKSTSSGEALAIPGYQTKCDPAPKRSRRKPPPKDETVIKEEVLASPSLPTDIQQLQSEKEKLERKQALLAEELAALERQSASHGGAPPADSEDDEDDSSEESRSESTDDDVMQIDD